VVDGATGQPTTITSVTITIENEDGAWEGAEMGFASGDEENDDPMRLLTGTGAYEGLYALLYQITPPEEVAVTCAADHRGVVFEQAPLMEP
jgi:hypothetical protein